MDCIPKLLNGNNDHQCQSFPISLGQDVVEPVNNAYVIVVPVNRTTIEKNCKERGYEEISQPQLVYIPYKCSLVINSHIYSNDVTSPLETPLQLPEIETTKLDPENHPMKVLDTINLDGLTNLQKLAEKTQLHRLQALEEDNTQYTALYICIVLIIIIVIYILIVILFKYQNNFSKYFRKNNRKPKIESENNPTVLFSS